MQAHDEAIHRGGSESRKLDSDRDEANLVGQVAGMVAMMSAMVQALPPLTRKRVLQRMHPQFESLINAMGATGAAEAGPAREGAEWVRDLFLQQIAKAEKKPKSREISSQAGQALDMEL